MKMKLMIITGVVALGIGQVQAIQWVTKATCNVTGGYLQTYLYDCLKGVTPPNCDYAIPPFGLPPCGRWRHTFVDVWNGVNCPPSGDITYNFWMNDGHGGTVIVASWTAIAVGTCDQGFESEGTVVCFFPLCPHLLLDFSDPTIPETITVRYHSPEETDAVLGWNNTPESQSVHIHP